MATDSWEDRLTCRWTSEGRLDITGFPDDMPICLRYYLSSIKSEKWPRALHLIQQGEGHCFLSGTGISFSRDYESSSSEEDRPRRGRLPEDEVEVFKGRAKNRVKRLQFLRTVATCLSERRKTHVPLDGEMQFRDYVDEEQGIRKADQHAEVVETGTARRRRPGAVQRQTLASIPAETTMATILLPGASLGRGKNFLPAVERARHADEFPLPNPTAQFDAENPLSTMTISDIEGRLRNLLCHNTNPRLLLDLAELKDQHQSWVRLAHFLILRANELQQETGDTMRPDSQTRKMTYVVFTFLVVQQLAFGIFSVVSVILNPVCGGQFEPNITRLNEIIHRNLHGQPLVHDIVVRYVTDHLNTQSPERALMMSFHGPPGVGKYYVGGMIAENIFLDGLNSPCVRLYIATRHFPFHDWDSIKSYKDKLHRLIPEAVRYCQRTLFIFDETDKMPEGLIDTIKPYVDGAPVDGQNFNKAMFLFLSKTAAGAITNKFIELRKGGTDRRNFRIKEFENIVKQSAMTTDGTDEKMGMWNSALVKDDLVHVVPFLPLELKEVEMCIRDVLLALGRKAAKEMLEKIAGEISFIEKDGMKYSENGCRDVRSRTLLHLGP